MILKMNSEKFKELAEQAGLSYFNHITNETNVTAGEFKYPRIEDYQKFAELIVKECAEICLEANDHNNILRHFGVE